MDQDSKDVLEDVHLVSAKDSCWEYYDYSSYEKKRVIRLEQIITEAPEDNDLEPMEMENDTSNIKKLNELILYG